MIVLRIILPQILFHTNDMKYYKLEILPHSKIQDHFSLYFKVKWSYILEGSVTIKTNLISTINLKTEPCKTWSIAHGIKQRRLSLPEKRCGNELGKDGTACGNANVEYLA